MNAQYLRDRESPRVRRHLSDAADSHKSEAKEGGLSGSPMKRGDSKRSLEFRTPSKPSKTRHIRSRSSTSGTGEVMPTAKAEWRTQTDSKCPIEARFREGKSGFVNEELSSPLGISPNDEHVLRNKEHNLLKGHASTTRDSKSTDTVPLALAEGNASVKEVSTVAVGTTLVGEIQPSDRTSNGKFGSEYTFQSRTSDPADGSVELMINQGNKKSIGSQTLDCLPEVDKIQAQGTADTSASIVTAVNEKAAFRALSATRVEFSEPDLEARTASHITGSLPGPTKCDNIHKNRMEPSEVPHDYPDAVPNAPVRIKSPARQPQGFLAVSLPEIAKSNDRLEMSHQTISFAEPTTPVVTHKKRHRTFATVKEESAVANSIGAQSNIEGTPVQSSSYAVEHILNEGCPVSGIFFYNISHNLYYMDFNLYSVRT